MGERVYHSEETVMFELVLIMILSILGNLFVLFLCWMGWLGKKMTVQRWWHCQATDAGWEQLAKEDDEGEMMEG